MLTKSFLGGAVQPKTVVLLVPVIDVQTGIVGTGFDGCVRPKQPVRTRQHLLTNARFADGCPLGIEVHHAPNRVSVRTRPRSFQHFNPTQRGKVNIVQKRRAVAVGQGNVVQVRFVAYAVEVGLVPVAPNHNPVSGVQPSASRLSHPE